MFTLYEYWRGLEKHERIQFCEKSNVSYGYMESHLIHGRKKPSMETVQALVDASDEKLSHKGLFEFFLQKSTAAQVGS